MALQIGIVGLPNVGKSTLFNALTKSAQAEARNFPFTTIEPNVGRIPVPDTRLDELARIESSARVVPTSIEFVDIAGLVEGAHKGEGLGNQFLANIREVDAIAHVVRGFQDGNITHVSGSVDPVRDADIINTELLLADLATAERNRDKTKSNAKSGAKAAVFEAEIAEKLYQHLEAGKPAREFPIDSEEAKEAVYRLHLLTGKPIFYILNLSEEDLPSGKSRATELGEQLGAPVIPIVAKIEAEVVALSPDEQVEYLQSIGLERTGLQELVHTGYELLNLITYLTAGKEEARAWTVKAGSTAPQAAGVIHTDFEKGFIKAEVVSYSDFVASNGWTGSRNAGKVRLEGKDYIVQDGDVMLFKFNV